MANINIRIDENTKRDAEIIFDSLGMTATTAITLFYRQVIRTGGIPFELLVKTPNKKTIKAINEVEKIERHNIKSKIYLDSGELLKDLQK